MVRVLGTKLTFQIGPHLWFSLRIYKSHDVDLTNPVTYSDVLKAFRKLILSEHPFEGGEIVFTLSPTLYANRNPIGPHPGLNQHIFVFSKAFDEFYEEEHAFNPAHDLVYFNHLKAVLTEFACILFPTFYDIHNQYYYHDHAPRPDGVITTRRDWHIIFKPELLNALSPLVRERVGVQIDIPSGTPISVHNNDFFIARLMTCYALHIFISSSNKNSIYRAANRRLTEGERNLFREIIAAQARIQGAKADRWLAKEFHGSTPLQIEYLRAQLDRYRGDHPLIAQGYGDIDDEYQMDISPRAAMSEREAFDRLCESDLDFLDRVLDFTFKSIQDSKQLRNSYI